jgi:hypothetical protein
MSGDLSDSEKNVLILSILAEEKEIVGRIRWRSKGRADYSTCQLKVICKAHPNVLLRLVMVAHTQKLPRKSSITLLFGLDRIFSLDINPGRGHANRLTLGSVRVTHWHVWGRVDPIPDDRDRPYSEWFDDFLKKSNSKFLGERKSPPYNPEQLVLIL